MSVFDRYAPFVQDFIYENGWDSLRGIQVAAGDAIFNSDDHVLLCASTASGKTEAAFFPILTEFWESPPASVGAIYVGPTKALINDQFYRLTDLCARANIPVWHWHGDALSQPMPGSRGKILDDLEREGFVRRNDGGSWDVTNLGALSIAFDLGKFDGLARRAVRVIQYSGTSRTDEGKREWEFPAGYATSFDEIVRHVMAITPQRESIDGAIRRQETAFPEIAVRELLANTMVHQDIGQRGTNPMVEVFDNRVEFSNAGGPLVDIVRIVDTVPVSRNESLAGFMRKCGICEERGSGFDKVVEATCENELVAPIVQDQGGRFTKVVLFSRIPFELTTKADRIRTCYMQACLAYVNFSVIGNSDVRRAFGLGSNKSQATRIIKDTLAAGLIKPVDSAAAPRYVRYIPFWG